jgi:beta-glucuronidase
MRKSSLLRVFQFAIATTLLLASLSSFAATRIDLNNNWSFHVDPKREGEQAGWQKQMPGETESVSIPHTWNVGTHKDYVGVAWYFRHFSAPVQKVGLHYEIHFGATFYKSRVWLNGTELGSHEGGYTSYYFDITPYLRESNQLAVEIDNRPGAATIPGFAQRLGENTWYDWWHYGGIVRDVWLTENEPVLVRRQKIRSHVDGASAQTSDVVFLENTGKSDKAVQVRVVASIDGQDAPVAEQTIPLALKPGASQTEIKLKIDAPRLWSFDIPNLYSMKVEVKDRAGHSIDEQQDTFGIRTIEIKDRHLLVNGERVRLSGITRHEESPWEGLAETRGTMRHDYDDLKNLQVTLTRPVHYPQHPYILDYADRNGILFMPEIPLWQVTEKQLSNPKVLALAKQQMQEMIEQAGNHPSIFAWSVCNESETNKPRGIEYFRAMKEFIHQIDPERYVSFANNNLPNQGKPEDDGAYYADFIMMNEYFGSWSGPANLLAPALDKVNASYPDKMVIISEFGFAGIFSNTSREGDEARIHILREQMPEIARRDWIAGAILWCYQDYESHRNILPGLTEGPVDMGIVDENRQRRPSYDVWREMNFPVTLSGDFLPSPTYIPSKFSLNVARKPETDLPSYPLHHYRLEWKVCDQRNEVIASGEQEYENLTEARTVPVAWKETPNDFLTVEVRVLRPNGFIAAEKNFRWSAGRQGGDMDYHPQ